MTELCLRFLAENLGLLLMTSIYCGKSSFVLVPHPLVISLSLYFGYSVASVSCFDVLACKSCGVLAPNQGSNPNPLLWRQSLNHGATRAVSRSEQFYIKTSIVALVATLSPRGRPCQHRGNGGPGRVGARIARDTTDLPHSLWH